MKKQNSNDNYFYEYQQMNASLLFGLIIITLGFYIIPWIYTKNKEFEQIDKHTPDPNRGVVILLLLPFFWTFSFFVIFNLITKHPLAITVFMVGISVIIFLFLKYIWDFCQSFGRITDTSGVIWFFMCIFPPLTIPAMQAELNSHFNRIQMSKKYNQLYK